MYLYTRPLPSNLIPPALGKRANPLEWLVGEIALHLELIHAHARERVLADLEVDDECR